MSKNPLQEQSRQQELLRVAEQAAAWLVSLEDEPAREHEKLAQWLVESPLHTQMFLRAAAIDRKAATLHPEAVARLMKRWETTQDNVLPLREGAARRSQQDKKASFHWRSWRSFGLAAGLVLSVAALWALTSELGGQRYATDIGEQRSITLADGSIVHINTHSRIDVQYSERGRDIRLLQGEALFAVRSDASRPFRVHVNDSVVQALGTRFNVYRRGNDATVAVAEGLVRISDEHGSQERLAAGQSVTVGADGEIGKRATVDATRIAAWRTGQLVFERASLEEIVTEFNRYHREPRLEVDRSVGDRHRYTAVFDTNEPQTLLRFLEEDPELELVRRADALTIVPRGRYPPSSP